MVIEFLFHIFSCLFFVVGIHSQVEEELIEEDIGGWKQSSYYIS